MTGRCLCADRESVTLFISTNGTRRGKRKIIASIVSRVFDVDIRCMVTEMTVEIFFPSLRMIFEILKSKSSCSAEVE